MWNKRRLIGALGLMVAAGCQGPVIGGPCTYDEVDFTATPTGYTETAVLFLNPHGDEIDVQKDRFETLPGEGDAVTLHMMKITSGSCTPEIYTVVDDSAG